MKNRLLLAALLTLSFFCVGFAYRAQTSPKVQWEYKQICTPKDFKKLDADLAAINQAGAEGWEMSGAYSLFNSASCVMFKRQK